MLRQANRANRNRYEGYFIVGKKHGDGTYKCTNGNMYEGEWICDKKQGNGKATVFTPAPTGI
jgi:hypothetical protein